MKLIVRPPYRDERNILRIIKKLDTLYLVVPLNVNTEVAEEYITNNLRGTEFDSCHFVLNVHFLLLNYRTYAFIMSRVRC